MGALLIITGGASLFMFGGMYIFSLREVSPIIIFLTYVSIAVIIFGIGYAIYEEATEHLYSSAGGGSGSSKEELEHNRRVSDYAHAAQHARVVNSSKLYGSASKAAANMARDRAAARLFEK